MRIGAGYDVHRLVEGRKLILGGVDVPFEKGLLGHSDADVLIHAVCDALLGAAGLGDIGVHFPDTDPSYAGISSRSLLRNVVTKLSEKGLIVNNVDSIIVAQAPKLASHIPAMRNNLAVDLGISGDRVNIKATTTEGLGPEGRGEGIASYAVCTLTES
jgi:2-C-methyl-D-erythritol 2,4-cyclodiphosphate synthase